MRVIFDLDESPYLYWLEDETGSHIAIRDDCPPEIRKSLQKKLDQMQEYSSSRKKLDLLFHKDEKNE